MSPQHFDVLIIGAGISGISAGHYLQTHCPARTYAILEGRNDMGGTWDLFRYPGVRSDSDMFTLGYSFRPWKEAKAIADGPAILKYLRETAQEFGIGRHIRFQHRVRSASWSSAQARWTVEAEMGPDRQPVCLTCDFLFLCSGYYDYEKGHAPVFAGSEDFQGKVIHPQHWPKDLDYHGQRVVVIGSGATAVTLVPAMAQQAAHDAVLRLYRRTSCPSRRRTVLPAMIRRLLPEWCLLDYPLEECSSGHVLLSDVQALAGKGQEVSSLTRQKGTPAGRGRQRPFQASLPALGSTGLLHTRRRPVPLHARPAVHRSSPTRSVEKFTSHGILLQSGQELPADFIVTATGLKLLACGGIRLSVDGADVEPGKCLGYKGLMLSNVPNCAICVGYTNASWTLRTELACEYVCRLLNRMARRGYARMCPALAILAAAQPRPLLDLTSGYIQRGSDQFPKQGSQTPWVLRQNYILDLLSLHFGRIGDGTLVFSKGGITASHGPATRL